MRKLDAMLDEGTVGVIVGAIGGNIADRPMRYCTEADLPYPRVAIEMAFVKAMRQRSPADPRLETLKSVYITLDDFFLPPHEAAS